MNIRDLAHFNGIAIETGNRQRASMGTQGDMDTVWKGAAWICILSTLCMGCYSSAVIVEPTGTGEGKLPSGKIFLVMTKDSTRYEFVTPATVVEDSIVGMGGVPLDGVVLKSRVSIPLSSVAYVSLKKHKPVSTIVLVVVVAAGLLFAGFSASLSGMDFGGD